MSFESDERHIRASLGLHRGRRALGLALLASSGLALLLGVPTRDEPHPVLPPPPDLEAPSAPALPPQANRAPVRRRAPVPQTTHRQAPLRATPPIAAPLAELAPEVVPQRPAVKIEESPAPPEVDVAAAPDQPPAEPLPERAGHDGNGEAIARAIADAKRAAVRNCFEHELKQQPKLTGTVVVELDLAAPDRVEALRVSDDLNRPDFTRCVTAAMQGLRFAALDEDLSVRVPYTLSPVQR